jgi:hypothetical protein
MLFKQFWSYVRVALDLWARGSSEESRNEDWISLSALLVRGMFTTFSGGCIEVPMAITV